MDLKPFGLLVRPDANGNTGIFVGGSEVAYFDVNGNLFFLSSGVAKLAIGPSFAANPGVPYVSAPSANLVLATDGSVQIDRLADITGGGFGTLLLKKLKMRDIASGSSNPGFLRAYSDNFTTLTGELIPVVKGRVTGQTVGQTVIAAWTTPSQVDGSAQTDADYEITGNILVTAFTSGTVNLAVSYTDENSAVHSNDILAFISAAGTVTTGGNTAGAFKMLTVTIRAKASTTITVSTAGTFTATYNADASIRQVSA